MTDADEIASIGYIEVASTAIMRSLPRFGASSSFANLFGTKEEQTDYIVGLLFAGIFLFSIYFTWTIVLLLFKCLGPQRVGFLSGTAFQKPSDPTVAFSRPFWSRLVFLNASLFFIVFSVLFVTQGLTNLKTTVKTILDSTRDIIDTMEEVDVLVAKIQSIGSEVALTSATFVNQLANTSSSASVQDCLLDDAVQKETGQDFAKLISSIVDLLVESGNFQPTETKELLNSTEYIQDTANGLEEDTEHLDIGDWQSLIVIIPYIITPSFLMLGVSAAWIDFDMPKLRCLLSWLILPILVVQVIFSYAFSAGLLIAASANADFCSGGAGTPDGTVFEILAKRGWTEDDLEYQMLAFYVGQCAAATGNPFDFLLQYQRAMYSVRADIINFASALEQAGNTALSETCSRDVKLLDGLSLVLTEKLQTLAGTAVDVLSLLKCSNLVTLYTNPVYNGTCTYSITGVTWAWASFAVVACMGLIMIMLRSAWQLDVHTEFLDGIENKAKESENNQDDDDEYNGYNAGHSAGNNNSSDDERKGITEESEGPSGGAGGYGQLANDNSEDGDFGSGGVAANFVGFPSNAKSSELRVINKRR